MIIIIKQTRKMTSHLVIFRAFFAPPPIQSFFFLKKSRKSTNKKSGLKDLLAATIIVC